MTITDAVALAVPLVAVIVTLPGLTPVTVPNASPKLRESKGPAVATATSLLVQPTNGWSSKRPAASRTVARSTIVSPAPTVAEVGKTTTHPGAPPRTKTSTSAFRPFTTAATL